MTPLVRVDAWLLLGALFQCLLILKSRRFRLVEWLLPLILLLGISIGFFFLIRLASQDFSPAAEFFPIGFSLALTGAALYVAAFAPPRLNTTALLSLNVTFWAVYLGGGLSRAWLVPAVVMSAGTVLYAAGVGRSRLRARVALQAWALLASVMVAADGVPSLVVEFYKNDAHEELAHALSRLDLLVTGAQVFLMVLMAAGLLLVFDPDTWPAWLPDREEDERPRVLAVIVLFAQGAAFYWLRTQSGVLQGQFAALTVFAAMAHGAMSGSDAKGPAQVDTGFKFQLTNADDRELLWRIKDSLRSFF